MGLRETGPGGLCQVDYMSYCRSFVITGAKTPVIKGSVTCDDVIDQWSPVAPPSGTPHWLTHWKPQTLEATDSAKRAQYTMHAALSAMYVAGNCPPSTRKVLIY